MMRKEAFKRSISPRLVRRYQLGISLLMIWWLFPLLWQDLLSTKKELLLIGMAMINAGILALSIAAVLKKDLWVILCWLSAGLSFFTSFLIYPLSDVYLFFPISICLGMIMAGLGTWSYMKKAHVETLDEFIQSIPVPVVEVNKEGLVILWNQAFASVFMKPGIEYGSSDFSLHLKEIIETFKNLENRKVIEWVYNTRMYQIKIQPSSTSGAYRIYFFDISNEKNIEEKYRIIVEGTNEALVIVDLEGEISFVNQQFCKLFGYKKEELIGRLASGRIIDDSNCELIQRRIQDRKEGKGEIYHAKQKTKNGLEIWTLVNASPYRDHTGNIVGTVAAITDLSPLMQVQDALHDRNEEMKMFLYKASHDIKGPLASIKGILNLALDDKLASDTRNRYIHMAINSALKLDNAISDLVIVSQVHNQPLSVSQVRFPQLINRVVSGAEVVEVSGGIKLEVEAEVYTPFWSDDGILHSILENLISNACIYRQRDETQHEVLVKAESYHKGVRISISDNGTGIREDLQDKVFDMFFRADKHSVGTGLGLYIVKQGVKKLGGKVSLTSEEGAGTTVRLYIPSMEKPSPKTSSSTSTVNSQAYP